MATAYDEQYPPQLYSTYANAAGMSIDWVAAGKVHPVKDQGSCGSCWAFAAVAIMESMEMIQNGAPSITRLSEQEGVDCTSNDRYNLSMFGTTYGNGGCNGGWMHYYWNFSRDQGSMANVDYPYTA